MHEATTSRSDVLFSLVAVRGFGSTDPANFMELQSGWRMSPAENVSVDDGLVSLKTAQCIMKERPRFRRSKLDVAPPPLRCAGASLRCGGARGWSRSGVSGENCSRV